MPVRQIAGAAALLATLKKHTTSTDANLRRAAWQALLSTRPGELANSAAAIAADPDAFVREVAALGGSVEGLVPGPVALKLRDKMRKSKKVQSS